MKKAREETYDMLRYQVKAQVLWAEARRRLSEERGASLVETMVWAGAIAVAAVIIVGLIQGWGTNKVNALP